MIALRSAQFLFFTLAMNICTASIAIGQSAPTIRGAKTDLHSVHDTAAPARRSVKLTLDKSEVIDLETDVSDVIVSNPAMVETVVRTARRVYLTGTQTGQTSAVFVAADGRKIFTLDITVARDLASMTQLINRLIPDARVRAEAVNGDAVLLGAVRQPADAVRAAEIAARFMGDKDRVMNMLEVSLHEQVLLKVTIAEVQRGAVRRFGIDVKQLAAGANGLQVKGVSETAFPITSVSVPSSAIFDATKGVLSASPTGGALMAVWRAGGTTLEALVEAMERANLVRTLAEPTLASMSGESAEFLAGGEFPIPVSRDKDNVSVDWKKFGVGLSFTPIVMSEGRISLKIATEVSDLSSDGAVSANGFNIPAIKVRRASSTVELPSGGSLVMAGLISETAQRSAEGVPGLRQLPIIGPLFESRDFARSQTELVIIVTPYLAKAVPRQALSLPEADDATVRNSWRAGTSLLRTKSASEAAPATFSFFDH
ncbi:MAG: type II and III secretion system protein family protein [Hyphomicrobiales bacterium]|nr:type II and III secretion system protein family protein [Hyphomicrobiales bacterium]